MEPVSYIRAHHHLLDFTARCVDSFELKCAKIEALFFKASHIYKQSDLVELDGERCIPRVFVDLGARWIDESADGKETAVKAYIETQFVVEYTVPENWTGLALMLLP